MNSTRPLWVQSDGTVLLDGRHPDYEETRDFLREIAELQKRPGEWHTYRLTQVSLWNAAAAGRDCEYVIRQLTELARNEIPRRLEEEIRSQMSRYGQLRLSFSDGGLTLAAESAELMAMVCGWETVSSVFASPPRETSVVIHEGSRGWIKRELAARGYPVKDDAGFHAGESLEVAFREVSVLGKPIHLRDYQADAVKALLGDGRHDGGSGVIVLPCGAGKTWVGMAAIARLKVETLILTSNGVSVSQWITELLRNTTLSEDEVGEYTGHKKNVKPITVATYQVLTHRRSKDEEYPHLQLFVNRDWGLIIYDEVHLLPAPVFRMTAEIQATRRLGLTATLVREDGREGDAFALIGPKRYEIPWKAMEEKGWIAQAACTEVRVPLDPDTAITYANAPKRSRHRIAGENPRKAEVVKSLLERHSGLQTLIIGQYLDQLRELSRELSLPLITGEMPHRSRKQWFDRFNEGEIDVLLVSKVANFAVDLPNASVAIQVSGSYGSRQEEAQRLGRIMRPKRSGGGATFYSVVSEGTDEVEFARNRGRFLLEQGYPYEVDTWESLEKSVSSEEAKP
ncbi:DNA repair helicase XPB [Cohnella cholangitidis]|uniref:DNA 3'-5' helicase n=1 Tax=Cohnella cholangitidis TaxID=2598458 RepID=A0A7G5BTK0_9BACL|nr:DNA repair helicase XPB [Cohnella cholangitidis]QMV40284.1 DEAD/DEAH box helicase [Cohnella cholangitidis]